MHTDPFQRLGLDREVLTVSQLNQRARADLILDGTLLPGREAILHDGSSISTGALRSSAASRCARRSAAFISGA